MRVRFKDYLSWGKTQYNEMVLLEHEKNWPRHLIVYLKDGKEVLRIGYLGKKAALSIMENGLRKGGRLV